MPVHSVELGHFILLNVQIQDTGKVVAAHTICDVLHNHPQFSSPANSP